MISPTVLKTLTSFKKRDLERILDESGYTGCSFKSAEFLGLTNGREFCYKIKYWDDGGGPCEGTVVGKVFVRYHEDGTLTADF